MPKPEYEMVETRLARFYVEHPDGRVITQLVAEDEKRVIFKAEIHLDDSALVAATGWAEELRGGKPPNDLFAIENCETSAIGRSLANAGYAKTGARPSREEMGKRGRADLRVVEPPAHPSVAKAREALNADLLETDGIRDQLETLTGEARDQARAAIHKAGISLPLPDRVTEPEMDILEKALVDASP